MRPIDPKYHMEGDRVIKTGNGEPVPDDEPMILVRGRDELALPMLKYYLNLSIQAGCSQWHIDCVNERINAFRKFAETSATMKQPGITLGK